MKRILKSVVLITLFAVLGVTPVFAQENPTAKCEIRSLNMTKARNAEIPFNEGEWLTLLLVNKERMTNGLDPLTATPELQAACDVREKELNTLFDHTRPDGRDCFSVLNEAGVPYMTAGENIAAGQTSPYEVMDDWMNSPGHRGNILEEEFSHIGIGCAGRSYYGYNWVQMFTGHGYNCYPGGELDLGEELLVIPAGTEIEELMLYIAVGTYEDEMCYLPLSSEYFNGVNTNRLGSQKATISFLGYTGTLDVYVTFNDISESDYFYDPVIWAVENGITTGTSATTFSPDQFCTRGQSMALIWRAAGCESPENGKAPFSDVGESMYYHRAVLWAVENGITTGTSATTFSPDATCTRAQIVSFLWRCYGQPEPETDRNPFKDVKETDYYYKAVLWAVENGITTGTSATTFAPDNACTRAQIVTFLYRALAE